MIMTCVGGPWDRETVYLSDARATAVMDIPVRTSESTFKTIRGRYSRIGDSCVSTNLGVTLTLAVYWQPK